MKLEFSRLKLKNIQIPKFIKLPAMGALQEDGWTGRRTDRQTDMMKLIVAFRMLRTRLMKGMT